MTAAASWPTPWAYEVIRAALSEQASVEEAQRRRDQGQQASLWKMSKVVRLNFEAIIRSAPQTFSINDIRGACDRMMIPHSARGGLFAAAVKAGLIAPLYVQGYPCRVASTGRTAHAATVVVYERVTA